MDSLVENQLDQIESQFNYIDEIKNKTLKAVKVQLHTGLEGFESPKSYGIYRNTGGQALGVVGKDFQPMDLNMYLDAVVHSITESNLGLDLSQIKYNEYKGGKKVAFSIPLKEMEIKTSRMVGDIIKTKLLFKTGFDGTQKCTISYSTYRIWCSNGAGSWHEDETISFKNTIGNMNRSMLFTDNIFKVVENVNNYQTLLEKAALKPISQEDIDKFFLQVFGINSKTYSENKKRTQNIFDKINQSVAIEMQNTGDNMYSFLQGITRYTTHDLAEADEGDILFSTANVINQKAHNFVFSLN